MLKENLVTLRNLHGYSQEDIAEKIGISRQAYAKWESGATVPDIEKSMLLADFYGVTLDSLIRSGHSSSSEDSLLTPKGKNIWGSVLMNDRGQIVIPKEARDKFGLSNGSRLIVLSDDEGIALIDAEKFEENMRKMMELASKINNRD